MSLKEFREAVARVRLEREEKEARRTEQQRLENETTEFNVAWFHAYPLNVDFVDPAFQSAAVANLVALGRPIRERFWDFVLHEKMHAPDTAPQFYFAAEIIMYATCGDAATVRQYLAEGHAVLAGLIDAHRDWFHVLKSNPTDALPHTPPITQSGLARILGKNRYEVNNWVRADKLVTPDTQGNKKRWRHIDAAEQRTILEAIREENPELLSSDSAPESA